MITRLKRKLTHPSWYQETELGGLLADILQESLRLDMMTRPLRCGSRGRMLLCRKAKEKLGLQFKLIINEQQIL